MFTLLRQFALRGASPGSCGLNGILAETKLLGLEVTVIKPSITDGGCPAKPFPVCVGVGGHHAADGAVTD